MFVKYESLSRNMYKCCEVLLVAIIAPRLCEEHCARKFNYGLRIGLLLYEVCTLPQHTSKRKLFLHARYHHLPKEPTIQHEARCYHNPHILHGAHVRQNVHARRIPMHVRLQN
jgi:hypothetical protein